MGYLVFKLIHLIAIMGFFGALALSGERKLVASLRGLCLLMMVLAGFAMLGIGHLGFPVWAMGKTVLWLTLGVGLALARKYEAAPSRLLTFGLAVGFFAAALALFKPF